MTAPAPSSTFQRLANAYRLLSLRSDIDNIILELLGQFSLEKIYCDSDKETYQNLVITLLAQLNAIFNVQRLTLPSANLQVGWYLGFLASWEVTLRAVEFVLQVVVEGRESLWDSRLLKEKYLGEFLLNSLRLLTLHPKVPSTQKAKDRRDRFARVHGYLERVFDSYPDPGSFLLLICREVTDSLRADSNAVALPPRLKSELPNLASELYPLAECLRSEYIQTIVPAGGYAGDWLAQFLALRDVSQFVVGASVQYCVNRETRDCRLQTSSARSRNAVLHSLENIRLPPSLAKIDLLATFSDTFRVILPDTLNLGRPSSEESHVDEYEIDAIDALCARLNDRQLVNRVSDREMMHSISKITRNIELLDDPSGQFRAAKPKVYSFNCSKSHVAGDAQLKHCDSFSFPSEVREGLELIPLPPKSKCPICGEPVTMIREILLARNTWEILKSLEPNVDTINVERHLSAQFELLAPRPETGMSFQGYLSILGSSKATDATSSSPPEYRAAQWSSSPDRSRSLSINQALVSPNSPGFRRGLDTPRTEFAPSEDFTSSDGVGYIDTPRTADAKPSIEALVVPSSPDNTLARGGSQSRLQSLSTVSFGEAETLSRSRTVPLVTPPEKGKSKWGSFSKLTTSRREPPKPEPSGNSSSLSSATLESQKLEEIQLKSLVNASKATMRGKGAKNINVSLSQNSTYALFWTQASINIWDFGTSSPILGRAVLTESNCVLAAVTKVHLAYIIGTRDQKLTLRIVNLIQTAQPAIEYRMPSSPWCHSICISPKENYVVVGFADSTVRFFKPGRSEEPREDRLHRYHKDCRQCPPVETLSFSNDGMMLLASTRSSKNGMIQIYSRRFPFDDFQELISCRYHVPLHESEDNGVSSAIFRSGVGEEDLICMTTWTQSGVPVLVQPRDGHRSEIRTEVSSHQGKLGNRIQCAAFSPTGRELAMVNDKGHLYHISSLNASPMEVKRIATSKELTTKSDWFAMTFMSQDDERAIILAWADASKSVGYIKRIPVKYNVADNPITPLTPGGPLMVTPRFELPSEGREVQRVLAELEDGEIAPPPPLNIVKGKERERSWE